MKGERLLNAIGDINDRFITEAEEYKDSKKNFRRYAAYAACLTAAVFLFFPTLLTDGGELQVTDVETLYDVAANNFVSVYSPKEFIGSNPWDEAEGIKNLPVYKNLAYVDRSGAAAYHSNRKLMDIARDHARILGEDIDEFCYELSDQSVYAGTSEDNIPDEEYDAFSLMTNTKNYDISVFGNGSVSISPAAKPEYACDDSKEKSTEDTFNAYSLAEEFADEYSHLIGSGELTTDVTANYTYSSTPHYTISAYENSGNSLQSILNYNFSSVRFITDEYGSLMRITKDDILSSAEKIGDYDIIPASEAMKKLTNGEYLIKGLNVVGYIVGTQKINKDDVEYCTLVYSKDPVDEYFLPYYVFYVRTSLPEEYDEYEDKSIRHYAVYYVPAIEDRFVSYE